MIRSTSKLLKDAAKPQSTELLSKTRLPDDYFRIRDFEFVQPLYDLAFLLEIASLVNATEVPKYRTFSLWRAAYSLDGYGTTIDRWLDGIIPDAGLDYVPSSRIRKYLSEVRKIGTLHELRSYRSERFMRCLRLRSVRGLGPSQISLAALPTIKRQNWLSETSGDLDLSWQAGATIVGVQSSPSEMNQPSLTILIVDDEPNIRRVLSVGLESHGHKVIAVGNGHDALAEANQRSFDLAFVDLRLGTEDGMDLIPGRLAASPWMKVVVITAYATIASAMASKPIARAR